MKKIILEQHFDYVYNTYRAGTRPFQGIEMILSNMINNFKEITSHPCGSFSDTNDRIGKNAISDTAIVMSYSLLEGFFHEEYEHYLQKENPKKNQELSALISTLLNAHEIELKDWRKRKKLVDLVRVLRNGVAHRNGLVDGSLNKEKCIKLLKEDLFEYSPNYPTLSFDGALRLLREFEKIADDYSEAVFNNLNRKLSSINSYVL